jgi:hypothetical protein
MRARILASTLLLFAAPATALACGGHSEWDSRVSKQYRIPTALDAADAIEAAAVEFGVPVSLLQAVAHTESRWQHHPHRVNPDGRRGLFHLPQDRIDLAADWLDLSWGEANGDVVQHARIFAALLDEARPAIKGRAPTIGEWRGALAWALDLEADFEDRYADNILALVDAGLIDRLPSGEPVVIEPSPVDPAHRGWWAASQDRSADYGPAIWDPAPGCNYSNASRGIGDVDYVIIHTAQGSYSGTINWFKNCSANVSAHYVVSTTGQITQMVDEEDSAWHVSCWNSLSVGIEHEGYAEDPGTWYTTAMYQASAGLVADILASWNLPADRNHVRGQHDPAGAAHEPGRLHPPHRSVRRGLRHRGRHRGRAGHRLHDHQRRRLLLVQRHHRRPVHDLRERPGIRGGLPAQGRRPGDHQLGLHPAGRRPGRRRRRRR